jgi:hypothetical protein
MIDVPVLVKDALREGSYKKNYRFVVLNDDGTEDFTINNDNLVSESVNIDERMVSGDVLKFGLCEGSSLEFQYFDKVNITGRQLQAFIDVDFINYVNVYTNVDQVSRWGGATVAEDGKYRVFSAENEFNMVHITRDGSVLSYTPTTDETGTYAFINALAGDLVEVDWVETTYVNTYLQSYVITKQPATFPIPMGFFTVKNCSRQASTGIIKATCYNKLQSDYLDQKANDMLLEDFGGDATLELTLYDIQRYLLKDYEVLERPKESVPVAEEHRTAPLTILGYPYMAITESIDTPFSGYEISGIAGTTELHGLQFEMFAYSEGFSATVSAGQYWELEFLKGDIDVFVENLKTYMLDILMTARVAKNGAYPWEFYTREDWEQSMPIVPFMIMVGDTRYDLMVNPKEKIAEINALINQGPVEIIVYVPTIMGMLCRYQGSTWYQMVSPVSLGEPYEYEYWSANRTSVIKKTATPNILFSDGTVYNALAGEMFQVNIVNLNEAEKIPFVIGDMPEFTLRQLMTANYETVCQFGQLDRETDLFSGVELNHSRLLPQETLYPASDLYPSGAQESAFKSQYSKLWADEGNVHKWKYLIITYKGLDEGGNEKDYTLQRTVNNDGTDNYNCSDNWLFLNLIWTAEQVGEYADAMVEKMRDVTWFPFEMWAAGLPYLETGDEIEIPLGEESYTSYVLQRQLKGIQNLQDTYINGTLDIF